MQIDAAAIDIYNSTGLDTGGLTAWGERECICIGIFTTFDVIFIILWIMSKSAVQAVNKFLPPPETGHLNAL